MARRPVLVAFDIDVFEAASSAEEVRWPLARLRGEGVRVLAVAPGSEQLGWVRLGTVGLSKDVDGLVPLDLPGALVVSDTWRRIAREAGLAVDQLTVVAGRPDVLVAASGAGATTVQVPAPPQASIHDDVAVDLRGPDVAAAVEQMLDLPQAYARPPAGL